jgi:hypothetical protein
MSEPVLPYGRQPTRNYRPGARQVICVLGVLALCALGLFFAYRKYQHWCHDDYDCVSSALYAAAPNATISIGGEDEDGLGHYDVYEVRLDLDASGKRIIELAGPRGSCLCNGTHLILGRVGHSISPRSRPITSFNTSTSVAMATSQTFCPPSSRTINDLVNRYDELLAAVRQLPRAGQFTTQDGKTCELRILAVP